MTPDLATAEAIARDWCEAWSRRDLDAVLAHYAEDVEVCSPLVAERLDRLDGRLHGKDELRGYFAKGMANPALRFDFVDVLLGHGALTVLYRRETGLLVADTMELASDLTVRRMTACYAQPRPERP